MGKKLSKMNKGQSKHLRIYTGTRAVFIRLELLFYVLKKYLFRKKKYPLFILSSAKNGLLKTIHIKRKLSLRKIIRFNDSYFFSLEKPRWPSKAWDVMAAKGGLNLAAAGTKYKSNIDLAVCAITQKCAYSCKHCYEHQNIKGSETVPVEKWLETIKELQGIGTGVIVFSGGEPMLRFQDMLYLLEKADTNLSDFHMYTSGHGVSKEKVLSLKEAGLVAAAVGLDDVNPQRQNALRGNSNAYNQATSALKLLNQGGIFTYLNTCLSKELVQSGDLWNLLELAKKMHVGAIRLLEPKPCGGYLHTNMDTLFTDNDREITTQFFLEANQSNKYRNYPLVSYTDYLESPERLGCTMGGLSHLHINSKGHVEPCVFLPISFGSILDTNFSIIFKKMRKATPHSLRTQCPTFYLSNHIKRLSTKKSDRAISYTDIKEEWQEMFT